MVINKRKVTVLLLSLATIIISIFFYFSSRLYWKYDDQWIVGKTKDEIVKRYGKFDYQLYPDEIEGYYIGRNPEFKDRKLYYFVEFSNKKAKRVYISGLFWEN